jgi:hypothetical protein
MTNQLNTLETASTESPLVTRRESINRPLPLERKFFTLPDEHFEQSVYAFASQHNLQVRQFDSSALNQFHFVLAPKSDGSGKSSSLTVAVPTFALLGVDSQIGGERLLINLEREHATFTNAHFDSQFQKRYIDAYLERARPYITKQKRNCLLTLIASLVGVLVSVAICLWIGPQTGWFVLPFVSAVTCFFVALIAWQVYFYDGVSSLTLITKLPGLIPTIWRDAIRAANDTFGSAGVLLAFKARWQINHVLEIGEFDGVVAVLIRKGDHFYTLGTFHTEQLHSSGTES